MTEQRFAGSVIIVRRAVRVLRQAAPPPVATVRFETAPGEQAQVDFAQVRVWIADVAIAAQIFVMTLGFSRRCFAVAFARQRLREWLAGHEQAFQHFGGSPERVVVDNAKAMVLSHTRAAIRWHPTYTDFAGDYVFRPWARAPYRPQTKGKMESVNLAAQLLPGPSSMEIIRRTVAFTSSVCGSFGREQPNERSCRVRSAALPAA